VKLTHDTLLAYQGLNGVDGVCHVRAYEQPGRLPVVIAGALDDNPGTSLTNAVEMAAHAISSEIFRDGREFQLVEYHPGVPEESPALHFALVHFLHADSSEDPQDPAGIAGVIDLPDAQGRTVLFARRIAGDFRCPRWEPLADVHELLGCTVRTWPAGTYTTPTVAGREGEALQREVAARARAAVKRVASIIASR
jgi:hypothetical protein